MRLSVGTSGYSFPEWRGNFYPAGLPDSKMLESYAERLETVELNNTFYRMPSLEFLQGLAARVPEHFAFSLKAPRRITHIARLRNAERELTALFGAAEGLSHKLGPVLFQLPPFLKKDVGLVREFLAMVPRGRLVALEFRHPSWFDDETYGALQEGGAALVGGDPDEGGELPFVATAPFAYLRLRAPHYDAATLERWRDRLQQQPLERAYVYLKHEVHGPVFAHALAAAFAGLPLPSLPAVAAEPLPRSRYTRKSAVASAKPVARPPAKSPRTTAKKAPKATAKSVAKVKRKKTPRA